MEELLHYETNIWAVINRALDKKAHEILDEEPEEETRATAEMKHTGTLTFSGQPVAPTNLRFPGEYSFDQLLEQANERDKSSKSMRIQRIGLKSILHDGNMMEAIGEEDDTSRRATKDSVGLANQIADLPTTLRESDVSDEEKSEDDPPQEPALSKGSS